MDLPASIPSPLATAPALADLVERIPSARVVARYKDDFDIDVAEYFRNTDEIAVYKCGVTGFKFFYPYGLAGSASLYEQLEAQIPGYYDDAKWEHAVVAAEVRAGDRVLDIGCGRGSFLLKARSSQPTATVTGLESNPVAARHAAAAGIEIVDEFIEPHAERRPDFYDMVTAFQVVEHIAEPRRFLLACKAALKPGGLLVVAVPNDDSFVGMDRGNVLNGPPHHLGLWDRRSLAAITGILGLSLEMMETEPLNHPAWFQSVVEGKYLPKGWRRSLWYRLGGARVLARAIEENKAGIAGHTIIAAFRKPRRTDDPSRPTRSGSQAG